jgi:hypothetical protein
MAAWLGLPDRFLRVSGPRVNDAHPDAIDRAYGPPLPRQQVGSGDEEGCTQWVYRDLNPMAFDQPCDSTDVGSAISLSLRRT